MYNFKAGYMNLIYGQHITLYNYVKAAYVQLIFSWQYITPIPQ